MTDEMSKAVSLETAVEMFRAFKEADTLEKMGLVWDAEQGRYTNSSIVKWLDKSADGLIYGVQIPKYSANQTTEALKTDANAGLVLEASTNTRAGRNDYEGRKLFACPRVNGGVDKNGMPYVTAIEGIDSGFDCKAANTWALTPLYYVKRTETDEYYLRQYTDTATEGFDICAGAYTSSHEMRPFILRACYMDSGTDFSSVSGSAPAAATANGVEGYNGRISTPTNFWADDVSRGSVDGLTHLTAADVSWQLEFMQLMLGVKAPKSVVRGCISFASSTLTAQESHGRYIVVSKAFADTLPLGSSLSIGTVPSNGSYEDASRYRIAAFVNVEAIEDLDGQYMKVHLSGEALDVPANTGVATLWWRNGSCDQVLGTFGAPYEEGLQDGRSPFRFQNCEFMLGLEEIVGNMHFRSNGSVLASDIPLGSGEITWTPPSPPIYNSWREERYVSDYAFERDYCVPTGLYGTSTTGYCVALRPEYWVYNRGFNPYIVGGNFADGTDVAGVGSVRATPRIAQNCGSLIGSRLSSIGRSEVKTDGE